MNRIRGLSPKPGVFATIKDRRIKIWAAQSLVVVSSDVPAGTVLGFSKQPPGLRVAAGDRQLLVLEVQPDNGKRMSAADWARGTRIAPGDRFDTTAEGTV